MSTRPEQDNSQNSNSNEVFSQNRSSNPSLEKTQRPSLHSTSDIDSISSRHSKYRKKGTSKPFELFDTTRLLDLRKDEVALKREELVSREKFDAATIAKQHVESAFAEAQAIRERQQAKFEEEKQQKELLNLGYTSEELERDLGPD